MALALSIEISCKPSIIHKEVKDSLETSFFRRIATLQVICIRPTFYVLCAETLKLGTLDGKITIFSFLKCILYAK